MTTPSAPLLELTTLWIQVTGSWCNLTCTHCLNSSGPHNPWLKGLNTETVLRAIDEGADLGIREIYYTGGEPFLHKDMLLLISRALEVAATTVLTNGTLITDEVADKLAGLAQKSPYSLEIRISIDDIDPERNDRIRGKGALAKAVRALGLLHNRGLLPILTATEILKDTVTAENGMYERFRDFLLALGISKPRVKIMPVLPIGRMERPGGPLLTPEMLQGFDFSLLQCSETRVVAAGGVYACPILAGLPGARLAEKSLKASLEPCRLYHTACVTCYETGMTCKN
ncbi:MAG: radical SAM protein [Candidatus Methylomirabilales bacterium]